MTEQRVCLNAVSIQTLRELARIYSGLLAFRHTRLLIEFCGFSSCRDEAEEGATQAQRRFASLRRVDSHRDRLTA